MSAISERAPLVSQTDDQGEPNNPKKLGDIFYDALPSLSSSFGVRTHTVRSPWSHNNMSEGDIAIYNALFLLRDSIIFSTKTVIMDHGGYNRFLYADHPWKSKVSAFCREVLTWREEIWKSIVFWFGSVGLIVLSFIEPPSWCANDKFDFNTSHIHADPQFNSTKCFAVLTYSGPIPGGDPDVEVQYYPTWGSTLLTLPESLFMMKFCLFLLVVDLLLHFGKNGMSLETFFYITESEGKGMNAIQRMASINSVLSKKYTVVARTIRFTQVLSVFMLLIETFEWHKQMWHREWSPLWRALIFASYSEGNSLESLKDFATFIPTFLTKLFFHWV